MDRMQCQVRARKKWVEETMCVKVQTLWLSNFIMHKILIGAAATNSPWYLCCCSALIKCWTATAFDLDRNSIECKKHQQSSLVLTLCAAAHWITKLLSAISDEWCQVQCC